MNDNVDDHSLVDQVRAGQTEAFDILVGRYGDRLYNVMLHMANGDRELAAEFAQEAFVRAFERLHLFAGHSSFYTWLYRLARNRAIDLLARKRPKSMDQADLQTAGEQNPNRRPDEGPDGDMQRDEVKQAVQDALASLPVDQREIILLRDFDGHDYQHIASLLEVPPGTVKSRLNRARRALRDALDPVLAGADQ